MTARVDPALAIDDPAVFVAAAADCADADAAYLGEQMPDFLRGLAALWRHAAEIPHHDLCTGAKACSCVRGLLLRQAVPVCTAYLEHR